MNLQHMTVAIALSACAGCAMHDDHLRAKPLYVAEGQRSSSIHHASANEEARQRGAGRVRPVTYELDGDRKGPLWIHAAWKRECHGNSAEHYFEVWVTKEMSPAAARVAVDELVFERAVGHEWEKWTCTNASSCGKPAQVTEYDMGCRPTCIRGTAIHRGARIDASSGDPSCVPPKN